MDDEKYLVTMKNKLGKLDGEINELKRKTSHINSKGNEIFTNDVKDLDTIRNALHSNVGSLEVSGEEAWDKIKTIIQKDEEKLIRLLNKIKQKL